MSGTIRHYFACGNTCAGFVNFFPSNLQQLKKIFILKGGPGTGKSTLMKRIGQDYAEEGYQVEEIHCSSDPDSLDGVMIRALGVGIVDGTAPHVIEPTAPGALEEYVNLGMAWHTEALMPYTQEILDLNARISPLFQQTYHHLADAKKVHDEWERIYISHLSFSRADHLADRCIQEILQDRSLHKRGITYHRFFGGTTPTGALDYVENLTDAIPERFFMKGRPGSGKSTILKKIWYAGKKQGLNAEVYHCGFDPDSLDMVIFPEIGTCIFDSTAPHKYEPVREGDHLVDLYSELIAGDTDSKYENQLQEIEKRYQAEINKGVNTLYQAKTLHDQLETYYTQNTDFDVMNAFYEQIRQRIDLLPF